MFVIHSETASLAEYVSGKKKHYWMFQEGVWCFALHKEKHSSNRLQPDSWMNFLKRKWRKDKYRVWLCASDQGIRTLNTFDTQLETASVANLLIWSNDFKNTSDLMFVCSDLKKNNKWIRKNAFEKRFPHLSPPQIASESFALFSCILDGKLTASVEFSSFSRRARTWRTLSAWLVAPLALTHTHGT